MHFVELGSMGVISYDRSSKAHYFNLLNTIYAAESDTDRQAQQSSERHLN